MQNRNLVEAHFYAFHVIMFGRSKKISSWHGRCQCLFVVSETKHEGLKICKIKCNNQEKKIYKCKVEKIVGKIKLLFFFLTFMENIQKHKRLIDLLFHFTSFFGKTNIKFYCTIFFHF